MQINPRHPKISSRRAVNGFTLTDLAVTVAMLGVLVLLVLPTLGSAKISSRQLSCLNNLRQLGIASHMYVVEYQQYTGSLSVIYDAYVWPPRLLGYTGGQRNLFACPAAAASTRWDTNLNTSLRPVLINGKLDFFGVSMTSRFSYGIDDWGLNIANPTQLGLGGDIDGGGATGPVRDSDVVAPSQMIMLGDTLALTNTAEIEYAANLDPTSSSWANGSLNSNQVPSNRHAYQTDFVFTDGHTETPRRTDVINPANTFWRSRWNNDNQPHLEVTWTESPTYSTLDPSY
jgi:type II secretory pathway pseudopilin PulG